MRKMNFHTLAFIKGLMQRDRQVFVSLTASGLDVALYELGFLGWREAAFVSAPLDTLGDDLAQVQVGLQEAIEGWQLQPETGVSWVLPPDIVGVVQNKTAAVDGPELDQIFPFNREDILVSKALNGRDLCTSILWVHKDWVNVFQRISLKSGLRCCELFSRAQLFTKSLLPLANAHGVLIDEVRGEAFLHIFNGRHEVLRSKSLGADRTILLDAVITRELAGIEGNSVRMYTAGANQTALQFDKESSVGQSFSKSPPWTPSENLRTLALSLQQGIELDSTDAGVFKMVVKVSTIAVSLLLATLALVFWHNYELQIQIAQGRASVRKDLAVYEDAKALRLQAVRFAKVIELKDQFTNQPESFRILADVLGTLGPNASIHYFSQDGINVRLAGAVDPHRNKTISFQNSANFRDAQEIDPRSLKEAPKATFARNLVWSDPSTGTLAMPTKAKAP